MINSTCWVIVIAFGALLVAIGNIQYNRARESENKKEMASQAVLILRPELDRNLKILSEMQKNIPKNQIPVEAFDTAAWQTVSNGELVLGLDDILLPNMMKIYNLLNRANTIHFRIVETYIGVASSLSNIPAVRVELQNSLLAILSELEPVLREVVNQKI